MSARAEELAKRLRAFNNEVIAFVEGCSGEDWKKVLAREQWPVGVTARHIGTHSGILPLVKMIVAGEKLPEMTGEQLVEEANKHAREHADCGKAEVVELLRKEGEGLAGYMAGLSDAELDRAAHFSATNSDMSAQQFVEVVVLQSAGEHFANMKKALGT